MKGDAREGEWGEVPFSATNGMDQVITSMKFGNQYGWSVCWNWRIFITVLE